jgi:hypothetical protein
MPRLLAVLCGVKPSLSLGSVPMSSNSDAWLDPSDRDTSEGRFVNVRRDDADATDVGDFKEEM